ncbi:MAG TPA: O-antigen ligase family protein [Candidatus Dormibacteraeota bacterium]|nr:O-antigen ligase family protein [Candidatus Dormibacteraeota bacterium]
MSTPPASPHALAVYALGITAACLPLYVIRWHVGPLPTTLLEGMILVTAALWIFSLWKERRWPDWRTPYSIPTALLLLAGVIGILVAPDHVRAAGIYRAYFVEAIAVFYIAIDLLRSRDELHVLLLAAAVGACVMALGQIVLFVAALAQNTLQLGEAPSFLNTSANADAMYLEPALAFALAFTVWPSRPRERWIGGFVLGLVFVAIVMTLSRAAYLAMAVLGLVTALSQSSAIWRLRAMAVLAVLVLVAVEIPLIQLRLIYLPSSASNRENLYSETLQMLSQRPIFGAGISGFATRIAPFRPPSLPVQIYPHDIWLTTWSELGLLGLAAFAVIFFGLLWRGVGALSRVDDIYRPLLLGALGALVLYTVHGLFDSPYWKNDLSVEFWLLAAFQVAALRHATAPRAQAGRSPAPPPPT